jgi:outer membrane protein assembly factor BamD
MSRKAKQFLSLLAALHCCGGVFAQGTEEADAIRLYQRGMKLLGDGDTEESLERFNSVAKRYRGSQACAMALWEIYRIQETLGNDEAAFEALNRLATEQPGHFEKAQAAQLKLVRRLLGSDPKSKRSLEFKNTPKAVLPEILLAMLNAIVKSGHQSEAGIEAQFLRGLVHDRADQKQQAIASYEDFTENFPNHELADDAAFQVADIPYRQWKQMRGGSPRQREAAAVGLSWFLARYTESDKAAQARANLAEVHVAERRELLGLARFYESRSKQAAADVYYRQLGEKFPEFVTADETLATKVRASVATAKPTALTSGPEDRKVKPQ